MTQIRWFATLVLILFCSSVTGSELTNQYVSVRLDEGVSLSVPRSWLIMEGTEARAIEASVGAIIDLSGSSKYLQGSRRLLSAYFPDNTLYAAVTVTLTPFPKGSVALVASLSDSDIQQVDATTRNGLEKLQSLQGVRISDWVPMVRETRGSNIVLRAGYTRYADSGATKVQHFKLFGQGKLLDVFLSSRAGAERVNAPTLALMIQSLKLTGS